MGSKCWWHEKIDDGLLGAVIIIMALIYSTCVAIMYSEIKKWCWRLVFGTDTSCNMYKAKGLRPLTEASFKWESVHQKEEFKQNLALNLSENEIKLDKWITPLKPFNFIR